ncbi:hypothetical protein [Parabacteroides faecis]|uniref:hypothetical protein n=1 Tax=Parabacteroides faecis TaxID=1217282 RepID=UPI0035230316
METLLDKCKKIEEDYSIIIDYLEEKRYREYRGFQTFNSAIIPNPEILFIGINSGPGAYNEVNRGKCDIIYPNKLAGSLEMLDWYKPGNARGYSIAKRWIPVDWYRRDVKKVNNIFVRNMINLLYETAGRLSPDWIMKSDSSTLPLWYNGWGEKIMFMNLYPIATESAKDLYVILNRMVKENHLVSCWEGIDGRMDNWKIRRFFIHHVNQTIRLLKPKCIVCLGMSAYNDFMVKSEKRQLVKEEKTIGDTTYSVIGFSRKGAWGARVKDISRLIVP